MPTPCGSRFAASCKASASGRSCTGSHRPRSGRARRQRLDPGLHRGLRAAVARCTAGSGGRVVPTSAGRVESVQIVRTDTRHRVGERLRHRRAQAASDQAAARSSRPTPRSATTASPSCSIRTIAATAIRSSPARTVDHGSRSSRRCRTTEPPPRWRLSRCVRRAGRSTTTRSTVATTHSRSAVTTVDRPLRGGRPGGEGRPSVEPFTLGAGADRRRKGIAVKGLGGFHSMRRRPTKQLSPPFGLASIDPTSRSPSWFATSRQRGTSPRSPQRKPSC